MEKTRLGIVLAGAVTAGAFTAGVMDYIINTFKHWEEEHKKNPQDVPEPDVVLDVLTGASAGSIAAAVTTLGLATDSIPFVSDVQSPEAKKNILFDTWVNLGLEKDEMIMDSIFSLDDIEEDENKEQILRALLNTSFIDKMMRKLINKTKKSNKVTLPNFVNKDLEILMTLSNLRGLPIDMYFSTDDESVGHTMSYHKAYALFQYGKKSGNHEPMKLDFDIHNEKDLHIFLTCARASGAFPIGLQSIPIKEIDNDYIQANITRLFGDKSNIKPRLKAEKDYEFIAVDGGMTNNEPLAEALKSLKTHGDNYKMILIDPFPSHIPDVEAPYDVGKNSVYDMISPLFKTLRNQAIFKESDIVDLFSENTNKHMIWPTRYEIHKYEDGDDNRISKKNAIACGALSGFSGFLNRQFRVHDYQLGQKNAQNFLRYYFRRKIGENHSYPEEFIKKFGVEIDNEIEIPIVPDYTIETKISKNGHIKFKPSIEDELMDFPKIHIEPLVRSLEPYLKERVRKVVDISFDKIRKPKEKNRSERIHSLILERNKKTLWQRIKGNFFKKAGNFFMNSAGKGLLEKTVSDKIIDTMIEELDNYELIHKA